MARKFAGSSSSSAHPRSRGEHSSGFTARQWPAGSSPLARGTFDTMNTCCAVFRLIPARAGNIPLRMEGRRAAPAHPRSRGEHHRRRWQRLDSRWLIPARAGNMRLEWWPKSTGPAHPRSRGEHHFAPSQSLGVIGSSPLARGTCPYFLVQLLPGRLIPARAGNMTAPPCEATSTAAHPRSRGEHAPICSSSSSQAGSSPLARGTSLSWLVCRLSWRLIPARAGNISGQPD